MMQDIERLRDKEWLDRLYRKIDALIIGYNMQTEEISELRRRLDNHISKHKEYEGGGRPCPK